MSAEATSSHFKDNVREALRDAPLQKALSHVRANFIERRAESVKRLPEFERLRDSARDIKDHTLVDRT